MMTGLGTGRSVPARLLEVERAVFTSLRSPTGEGYRIIATSAGIRADEKREITRRAPSHGSLCDPSPGATGLASFALDGGRQCVFLCRNSEVEQTARGGCRIRTDVLVMDPEVYWQFHCDPLEVEAATLSKVGREPAETVPARLKPVTLQPADGRLAGPSRSAETWPINANLGRVAQVLSAVLGERRTLVVGAAMPREVLRWSLRATPAALRARLSLSVGLRFSLTRRFDLILADATPGEIERVLHDGAADVIRWGSPATPPSGPFEPWLRFVGQRWESGRAAEVAHLSAELTEDCSARALAQIARLCQDLERAQTADPALLRDLTRRHLRDAATSSVQRRLLAEFRRVVEVRRATLEERQRALAAQEEETTLGHA
jgi:hypothetical protein